MGRLVKGIVIKIYGGFYHVSDGGSILLCTVRGIFRHRKIDICVGDSVEVNLTGQAGGVVESVYPRRNALNRPPVANVDRAVIVFAVKDPDPLPALLDRFLIQSGHEGVQPVICFNKIDLLPEKGMDYASIYSAAGYTVLKTSARDGTGVGELRAILEKGISVFAGPSGAGKSSLLNAVQPGFSLKTGEIGQKLKRGRHTTRHVELLAMGEGGLVADSPGFSSLYLPPLKREELCYYFPEMKKFIPQCRFNGCLHRTEPGCVVKEAVDSEEIDGGRYGRYLELLNELINKERGYR